MLWAIDKQINRRRSYEYKITVERGEWEGEIIISYFGHVFCSLICIFAQYSFGFVYCSACDHLVLAWGQCTVKPTVNT